MYAQEIDHSSMILEAKCALIDKDHIRLVRLLHLRPGHASLVPYKASPYV